MHHVYRAYLVFKARGLNAGRRTADKRSLDVFSMTGVYSRSIAGEISAV